MRNYLYVPEKLNLPLHLRAIGDDNWNKPAHWDRYYYLIDYIYLARFTRDLEQGGYLPVNAKVLEGMLNHRWSTMVKDNLVRIGVFEPKLNKEGKPTFRPSVESKSYRFTAAYANAKFIRVPLANKKLFQHIEHVRHQRNDRAVENHEGKRLIRRSIEGITFDCEAAVEFVHTQSYKSEFAMRRRLAVIERFREHEFSFSSDKAGRFYHMFTICPRDLRKFATFNGKGFFEIDVSDCQPSLHVSLYPRASAERNRYIEVVSSGKFKSFINDKLPHPYDFEKEEQIKKFKRRMFKSVFYGSITAKPRQESEAFKAEFPELFHLIWKRKEQYGKRELPVAMQRLEANIAINTVATRLAKMHNADENFCLISIHDCFLTTLEYVAEVKSVFEEELERFLRFKPKLKEGRISKDCELLGLQGSPKLLPRVEKQTVSTDSKLLQENAFAA